ncbi:glycerol-3-phosphate dehydrogenase/oxidase [Parabacteroides bouchesdurhonensis]|uniref:glycerol-3-phosphate dehydrogenase/oxidase n=1 Tax=Parabacteroides bouchesdurhonensis TaxID=1936995 RepID=UPI000E50F669|nr:glycerol-3-phosphate dehydrogenase/oxidase [Parabacteroides bouchesdurhonensis]RHJ95180.1 glycerol-3-phosphate dehydrogenase/oxidase [Bacteroides sp. AM07-16]
MKRESVISQLTDKDEPFDFVVIGGGATGLGVAVDAATRGYSVALFEQNDFTKGTSSRSTKLVHGGVRYLAQGDVSLVLEALRERGLLRKNAPHLVKDQKFLIPCYRWWEGPFYAIGLILYDLMAGKLGLGRSICIGPKRALKTVPRLVPKGMTAGIIYHDGQFDDSRLAMHLVRSAIDAGGCVLNYMKVTSLVKEKGKIVGVVVCDRETDISYTIKARCVINATGVFADDILQMDEPGKRRTVRPSQGVHLVLDSSFLESDCAVMIPKTSDGRVLFAVPWHNKVVVGTTDTLMDHADEEPVALEKEIDFILETAGKYLTKPPKRSDVLSVFAGLRPLAAPRSEGTKTKEISRSHKLIREKSGLITIIGGKWTTYRKMAQDTLDYAIRYMHVPTHDCVTETFSIHGSKPDPDFSDPLYVYGSDAEEIKQIIQSSPEMSEQLHPDYHYTVGEVVWIIRNEMPRSVEDILARRFRILFMDARAAIAMAPRVAVILAKEWGKDENWQSMQVKNFNQIASNYILN